MADSANITRRRALTSIAAIPAMGTAAIVPAMAAPVEEQIADRVSRLTKELSYALDEFADGQFKAVCYPMSHPTGVTMLQDAAEPQRSPHEQAIWHIRELERLIAEDGGIATYVAVMGHYRKSKRGHAIQCRAIMSHDGRLNDVDGMFAAQA